VYAQSDPGTTRAGQTQEIARDSAYRNVVSKVYDGRVAYVRIETRESGAPLNQHPVSIEPASLRGLLTRFQTPKNEALFDPEELDEIVTPLAQALGRVRPEQDVSFAVSGRHGLLGPLAPRSVTTARVFFIDGRMNFIFGLVQLDWESRYRGSGYLIPFEPGKRSAAVDKNARVIADGAVSKRADWLQVDPLAPPPVATPAPDAPKPAVVIPPATAGAAAAGAAAQPATPAAPTPAAQPPTPEPPVPQPPAPQPPKPQPAPPPAPAPAAPAADGETLYRQTAERLKALQKLRDSGAITEEEYQQKRREILKGL
jgi:hypothetical protein